MTLPTLQISRRSASNLDVHWCRHADG